MDWMKLHKKLLLNVNETGSAFTYYLSQCALHAEEYEKAYGKMYMPLATPHAVVRGISDGRKLLEAAHRVFMPVSVETTTLWKHAESAVEMRLVDHLWLLKDEGPKKPLPTKDQVEKASEFARRWEPYLMCKVPEPTQITEDQIRLLIMLPPGMELPARVS